MTIKYNEGYLTSTEAAEQLGVTAHQVAMLAKRGEFGSVMIGHSLLVDPYSLQVYANLRQGKGRPWDGETTWAALWALSGLGFDWLPYQKRRRLGMQLRTIETDDLVWKARKRAVMRAYRCNPETFPDIRRELMLSGKSTDRPDIFGMPRNRRELEGYATIERVASLEQAYSLTPDISGNLLVHVLDQTPWQGHTAVTQQMPVAVVAADLAASLDQRESHAGRAALDILLSGLRNI